MNEKSKSKADGQTKIQSKISSSARSFLHSVRYSFRESTRNKLSYLVGCGSVFLVVFAVALILTIISLSPIVFLQISEATFGEADLLLTNTDSSGSSRLNFTIISESVAALQDTSSFSGGSPRIADISSQIFNPSICGVSNMVESINRSFLYTMQSTFSNCYGREPYESISLWAIDTERERSANIGRAWEFPALGVGEVYINSRLSSKIGARWVLILTAVLATY